MMTREEKIAKLERARKIRMLEEKRASASSPVEPDKSFLQSAGESVNDFMTNLSNNPVGRAAAELASYPGAAVASIGTDKPFEQARQELLAQDQQQYVDSAKRSPIASGAGSLISSVAAGPQGGGVLANIVADTGIAGADSLIQGKSGTDAAKDALLAGGLSGAAGFGAKLVGGVASKLAPKLDEMANEAAVNAVGGTPKMAHLLEENAQEIGPVLREGGVIKLGRDARGIEKSVDRLKSDIGSRLGESRKLADEMGAQVDLGSLQYGKLDQLLNSQGLSGTERKALEAYFNEIQDVPGSISVQRAQELLEPIRKNAEAIATDSPTKQGLGDLYQDLRKAQASAVEGSLPSEWGAQYTKDRNSYRLLVDAEKAAENQAARAASRESIGLKDLAAGGLLSGGDLGTGVATAATTSLIRSRGPATKAAAYDSLANMVKATPEKLGKYAPVLQQAAARSPQALNATSFLLQKQDPEFRKLMNGESE